MKVLFLNSGALPLPAVKGGAVETLLDYLTQKNEEYKQMQLEIISIYDKAAEQEAKKYPHTCFRYIKIPLAIHTLDKLLFQFVQDILHKKNSIKFSHAFTMLFFYRKIAKLLSENDYDKVILEVNGSLFLTLKMKHNDKKYKGRYYYYLHSQAGGAYGCEDIITACKKVICVSDYIRRSLPEYMKKMEPSQLAVLPICMDWERFHPNQDLEQVQRLKDKYGILPDEKLVLFTGRLNPDKGIRELLEAFKKLDRPGVKLLVVGSFFFGKDIHSSFKQEMEALVEAIKSRIIFTGFIPYDEMPLIYAMGDFAVLPSMWEEPAGMTVIESMASGLPVITTCSGGIPEYVNEQCAVILNRDEHLVDNIAISMQKLLNNPALCKEMGEAGRKTSEKYNLDHYYLNFMKIISQ